MIIPAMQSLYNGVDRGIIGSTQCNDRSSCVVNPSILTFRVLDRRALTGSVGSPYFDSVLVASTKSTPVLATPTSGYLAESMGFGPMASGTDTPSFGIGYLTLAFVE